MSNQMKIVSSVARQLTKVPTLVLCLLRGWPLASSQGYQSKPQPHSFDDKPSYLTDILSFVASLHRSATVMFGVTRLCATYPCWNGHYRQLVVHFIVGEEGDESALSIPQTGAWAHQALDLVARNS